MSESRTPIPFLGPEIYDGIYHRGLSVDDFGWNSHHPMFAELIAEVKPKTIIEVGTWKGASALHMASLTRDLGSKIYCVDTWIGGDGHISSELAESQSVMRDSHGWPGVYYQFLHNVKAAGFENRITPVPFMTQHAALLFKAHNLKADLIYIDAGHFYIDVVLDIHAYFVILEAGGVMFGDDYNYPGVKQAVAETMENINTTHCLTTSGEKWAIKPIKQ